jgi:hypothetical protein
MIESLPVALETYHPTVVVIETSVNDSRIDLAISSVTTLANLRKMVGMCRAAGAKPVLLTSTPINAAQFDPGGTSYGPASVSKQLVNNDNTRTLATEMGVTLVDEYTIFDPLSDYLLDGVHLNTYGTDVMGQTIAAAITGNPNPIVPPVATVTLATDTFTRADSSTTLGNTDDGKAWTNTVGVVGIASGKAYAASPASNTQKVATVDVAQAGHTVTAQVTAGTGSVGVVARLVDSSNFLWFSYGGGTLRIFKTVAGAPSTLANVATTWAAGEVHVMKLETVGNVINAYVDGLKILTTTLAGADITTFATATKVGLVFSGFAVAAAQADNFKATMPA